MTSFLKKERQGTELEGEAGDGGGCLLQRSGAETQGVGIREKGLPAEGGNGFGLFTEQPGGHCAWSTVMGVEESWPQPNLPDCKKNLGFGVSSILLKGRKSLGTLIHDGHESLG